MIDNITNTLREWEAYGSHGNLANSGVSCLYSYYWIGARWVVATPRDAIDMRSHYINYCMLSSYGRFGIGTNSGGFYCVDAYGGIEYISYYIATYDSDAIDMLSNFIGLIAWYHYGHLRSVVGLCGLLSLPGNAGLGTLTWYIATLLSMKIMILLL